MELLHCFVSVPDHRKVTAAAMQITQPARSKNIQRREKELGIRPFDHLPCGVIPTG